MLPLWQMHGSYLLDADVDEVGADHFGVVGFDGGGGLAYFRTDYGDFDFTGDYDLQIFTADGGIGLPDQLGAFALNGTYVGRNAEGQAMKLTVSPSLRSDLEPLDFDSFYVPLSFTAIQSFSPDVSGQIGVAIFPWFEQLFDPLFGIRWAIADYLVLDLMYPESKLVFMPEEDWDLYAGIKISNTPEWHLDDDRKSIMIDETRAYFGVNHPLDGEVRMMYQAGLIFNRSVDFDRLDRESTVKDAMFISVGVGGSL